MTALDPPPGREPDPVLVLLQQDVVHARAAIRTVLEQRSAQPVHLTAAREESRRALERFVAGLAARSLPVPRAINAELQLIRSLCGTQSRRR